MKVGDLVKGFLTEQVGVILEKKGDLFHVLWATQGLSLFGPGHKEWISWASLETL